MRKPLFLLLFFLAGCSTYNTTVSIPPGVTGGCSNVNLNINGSREVHTTPSITANGNEVPVSAVP